MKIKNIKNFIQIILSEFVVIKIVLSSTTLFILAYELFNFLEPLALKLQKEQETILWNDLKKVTKKIKLPDFYTLFINGYFYKDSISLLHLTKFNNYSNEFKLDNVLLSV